MEIHEKIQVFFEVASRQKEPIELKNLLAESEPNWIADAVDQLVVSRLNSVTTQKFRLKIAEMVPDPSQLVDFETETLDLDGTPRKVKVKVPKKVERAQFTEWQPEVSQFSVAQVVGQMRQLFPNAAISVERQ